MTLRKGHGAGAGVPRIEVLPPDELPDPVPGTPDPVARREDGTIADSATAKALGARGGLAKATKKRMLQGIGLANLTEADAFKPYWTSTEAWVEAQLVTLASIAGGRLGPGPQSIIGTAGVQLAASRFFSDQGAVTGNPQTFIVAMRLGDASRQNIMAAYEMAVREAKARAELNDVNPYAGLLEAASED